ncbi:MAG: glucosamine-6-phosphate deaminase [Acidobacteria bacterium]|nr:glucosamine-6-phosphate deaminase [Acidobacteriota bacterium]
MNNTVPLSLHIADSRRQLGQQAATDIAKAIRAKLATKQHLHIIFAAAPSQSEMLTALQQEPGIDWSRVTAFHMDEYVGLADDAPQRFGNWLRREFFDCVPLAAYHLIDPGWDPESACKHYTDLLASKDIDFVLLGIGANAHLAFNDPPADLQDPLTVKVVSLDEVCRQQQVDDDCFATFADVPLQAITLTIPTLLRGEELFCCVPGTNKAAAVRAMMTAPISGEVPATALRMHPRCTVYLNQESSALL